MDCWPSSVQCGPTKPDYSIPSYSNTYWTIQPHTTALANNTHTINICPSHSTSRSHQSQPYYTLGLPYPTLSHYIQNPYKSNNNTAMICLDKRYDWIGTPAVGETHTTTSLVAHITHSSALGHSLKHMHPLTHVQIEHSTAYLLRITFPHMCKRRLDSLVASLHIGIHTNNPSRMHTHTPSA